MTGKLGEAFDFRGRLSRVGQMRLGRTLLLIALPGVIAPMLLLIAGVPRIVAILPVVVLAPVLVAAAAANVRRLHDVGRHAHRVYAKRLIFSACLIGLLAVVIAVPDLPEWAAWTLIGMAMTAFVAGFFIRDLGNPEWRRGDPAPNRFGLPPE